MGRFGTIEILVIILCLALLSIPFLFLRTLQNTIKAANPRNRAIEPYEVWFALIPVLGIILHISHIYKISHTLKKDFEYRKVKNYNDAIFGKSTGLTYAYISLINFIIYFLLYRYIIKKYEYFDLASISYYESSNMQVLFKVLLSLSISSVILLLVYWNKMSRCKSILLTDARQKPKSYSNKKPNYLNLDSNFESKKKCKQCNAECLVEDHFCMKCGGSEFLTSAEIKINSISNLHENKKECPNCKIDLPKYVKICSACNYDFHSDISLQTVGDQNKDQEFVLETKATDINNVNQETQEEKYKSHKILYIILSVLILLAVIWYYFDVKNKNVLDRNMRLQLQQDSILSAQSKDSILEELNKYKTKIYQDSISESEQKADSASYEEQLSNENSNLRIGGTYEGNTIIYLDDSYEHGIVCSEPMITDRVNSLEISKQKCASYAINNNGNWRLPSRSDFLLIAKQRNYVDLKNESFWTSNEDSNYGLVYESFRNSFISSTKDWQSSALIFVKDF